MIGEEGRSWPPGAVKDSFGWNFAVQSDDPVNLVLFNKREKTVLPMKKGRGRMYTLHVSENLPEEMTYMFQKNDILFTDQMAKEVLKPGLFGERIPEECIRCALPQSLKPAKLRQNKTGAALCLHVRGFTKHSSAVVKHPGTFEGVAEKLSFIKDLGFEEIILLPIYDFDERSNGKTNYWGYGSGRFQSPNSHFSAEKSGRKSFKKLCDAAEKLQIAVTLYLPFSSDFGIFHARECLLSYVYEYGIRDFILNPGNININALREDPLLSAVTISTIDDGFMESERMFLRGDAGKALWAGRCFAEYGMHYVTRHTGFTLRDLYTYERKHNEMNGEGNFDGPEESFGYNCGCEGETTDEETLKLRRQLIRNAVFVTLLSRGKPVMTAEDLLMHSRGGNNNPYCQDNFVTHIDWNKKDPEFLEFVRELLTFRAAHPLLMREEKSYRGCTPISFHGEAAWISPCHSYERGIGIMYTGKEESLLLLLNPWREKFEAGIPEAPFSSWETIFSSEKGSVKDRKPFKGIRKTVNPWNMEILISERKG